MHTHEKAVAAGTAHGSMNTCALNSTIGTDPESFALAAPAPFTPPAPQQIQARFDALMAGGWTQAGIVAEVRKRGVKLDVGDFSNARRGKHGKKLSREQWSALEALPVDHHQDDVILDHQDDVVVDHQDDEQAGATAGIDPAPYHRAAATTAQAMERMAQARRYLAILDPEAERFCFQTFDDTEQKRGYLAQTIVGDLDAVWSQLERLNQAGAGVFVTVNETRGQTRRAGDVVRVRAVFADFDPPKSAPAPALADYPLPPAMLVESSPGKAHAYWTVDGLDRLHFKPMQQAISGRLGSDPAPNDLPRVMRLPGFYHSKDPDHRHLVRVTWTDERQPYSPDQVRAAFGVNGQHHQAETRHQHHQGPEQTTTRPAQGDSPFAKINAKALMNLSAWVPALFGDKARAYQDGYRIASVDLNRRLQEDISILPAGIQDFGEERGKSAVDLVIDWGPATDAQSAAVWLCGQLGIDPAAIGFKSEQWPDLEPLVSITGADPYPVDALPERIRAAVAEVQGFVKAPLPLVAASALSALSVAGQGHVDVARGRRLKGPSSLFFLTIADSGDRKTSCDKVFAEPLRAFEADQAEAMKPDLEKYAAAAATWQAEVDGCLQGIKRVRNSGKGDIKQYKLTLEELEHCKPQRPRVPELLRGDDTPEHLARALVNRWPSAGLLENEAGVIFGSHGMGKDSVMRNLGQLNKLWDAEPLKIGRETSTSVTVRGVRFTLGLMVQESVLRDFFEKSGVIARGSGFLARFLLSWPESIQGTRLEPIVEPPEDAPALAAFHARIRDMLRSDLPIDTDGRLKPWLLTLSPDARRAWVEFHNAIELMLAPSGELYPVRDVAAKVADNAARLAALFHVFERNLAEPIGADLMERASRIVAWHLSEARRFYGELAVPPETLAAAQLEQWLVGHCREHGTDTVRRSVVQNAITPASLRRGDALTQAIQTLSEHGRVRMRVDGKKKLLQVRAEVLAA